MPDQNDQPAYIDMTQGAGEAPDGLTETYDAELSHPEFTGCYNILDELGAWVGESVTRHAKGESIRWGLGITALPDPQNDGMPYAALVITLGLNGAVTQTNIFNTAIEQPFGLNREAVDRGVAGLIEGLLTARSEQLGNYEKQATEAMASGNGGVSGGLWLPGS